MIRAPRLDSLTGLRFAAAMTVVLFHSISNPQTGHALVSIAFTSIFVEVGYVGVNFFFVLSGFVLAWSDKRDISSLFFYQKRIARIYPLHVFMLLLSGVGQIVFGFKTGPIGLFLSFFLLQAWFSDPTIHFAMNGVSWSLSVEAFFYILFPRVMSILTRLTERRLLLLISAMTAVEVIACLIFYFVLRSFDNESVWINPLFCLPQFIIGLSIGCNTKIIARLRKPMFAGYSFVVLSYLICGLTDYLLHVYGGVALPRTVTAAIMLPSICILIASAANKDLLHQGILWSKRSIVVLGEWSFALYLVHPLILALMTRVFRASTSYSFVSSLALECLFISLSIAAAGLAHYFIERPFERMIRPRRKIYQFNAAAH